MTTEDSLLIGPVLRPAAIQTGPVSQLLIGRGRRPLARGRRRGTRPMGELGEEAWGLIGCLCWPRPQADTQAVGLSSIWRTRGWLPGGWLQ